MTTLKPDPPELDDTARLDTARHDTARHDTARPDIARPDTARQAGPVDPDARDGDDTFVEPTQDPGQERRRVLLARIRLVAMAAWALAWIYNLAARGLTVDRPDLIAWTFSAVVAASIGRRRLATVFIDWLPFVALLIAYDASRGAAHYLGRPTLWTPQITIDTWLGFGHEPTVWLQEHLKHATVPWWEVIVSSTYVSYFLLPYGVAGVLWLRNRRLWRQFVVRYVVLSFIGIAGFVLVPAAPPWAAARCSAVQVASHPSSPACMNAAAKPPNNGLLGGYLHVDHPGASPYVEQLALRGYLRHGLPIAARAIDEGRIDANQVAALPSLHAGTSLLIALFLWPLVRRRWRPLLAMYPLMMAFSLVYSAEHYFFDILCGWVVAIVVMGGVAAWERRRDRAHDPSGRPEPAVCASTRG